MKKKNIPYFRLGLVGLLIVICIVLAFKSPKFTQQQESQNEMYGAEPFVDAELERLANDPQVQLRQARESLQSQYEQWQVTRQELSRALDDSFHLQTTVDAYRAALISLSKSFKQSPSKITQNQPFWMKPGDRTYVLSSSCGGGSATEIELESVDDAKIKVKIFGEPHEFLLNPYPRVWAPEETNFHLIDIKDGKALMIVNNLDAC